MRGKLFLETSLLIIGLPYAAKFWRIKKINNSDNKRNNNSQKASWWIQKREVMRFELFLGQISEKMM